MTRIIISGCNGKMGREIAARVKSRKDCQVVAGVDIFTESDGYFPVYATPGEIREEADVLIDFSNPALLSPLLSYALSKKIPSVLCTTGYSKEQVEELKRASAQIPVLYSRCV